MAEAKPVQVSDGQQTEAEVRGEQPALARIEIKPETPALVNASDNLTKAPTTTSEEDLHSKSQRRVNLIWEYTQQAIALIVVVTTMTAGIFITFKGYPESRLPTILSVAFGTVVGFYFGRTNHQSVGGVQLGR